MRTPSITSVGAARREAAAATSNWQPVTSGRLRASHIAVARVVRPRRPGAGGRPRRARGAARLRGLARCRGRRLMQCGGCLLPLLAQGFVMKPVGATPSARLGGCPMFNDNGSFLVALFEFFLFFAWFMCLFWVLGDIFRSKDLGGGSKTLWVIFVIVI